MTADLDAAGLALARARARRDSLSPTDAAKAAMPAGTAEQIAALASRIQGDREAAYKHPA